MDAQITVPKTFEQKVEDKIRDSIGDLIDQESLRKIIERGMAVEKAMAKGISTVVLEEVDSRMRWMFNNLLSMAQANKSQ